MCVLIDQLSVLGLVVLVAYSWNYRHGSAYVLVTSRIRGIVRYSYVGTIILRRLNCNIYSDELVGVDWLVGRGEKELICADDWWRSQKCVWPPDRSRRMRCATAARDAVRHSHSRCGRMNLVWLARPNARFVCTGRTTATPAASAAAAPPGGPAGGRDVRAAGWRPGCWSVFCRSVDGLAFGREGSAARRSLAWLAWCGGGGAHAARLVSSMPVSLLRNLLCVFWHASVDATVSSVIESSDSASILPCLR